MTRTCRAWSSSSGTWKPSLRTYEKRSRAYPSGSLSDVHSIRDLGTRYTGAPSLRSSGGQSVFPNSTTTHPFVPTGISHISLDRPLAHEPAKTAITRTTNSRVVVVHRRHRER